MYDLELTTTLKRAEHDEVSNPVVDEVETEKTTEAARGTCNCCLETNTLLSKKVVAHAEMVNEEIPGKGAEPTKCSVLVSSASAVDKPGDSGNAAIATMVDVKTHTLSGDSADPEVERKCSEKESVVV